MLRFLLGAISIVGFIASSFAFIGIFYGASTESKLAIALMVALVAGRFWRFLTAPSAPLSHAVAFGDRGTPPEAPEAADERSVSPTEPRQWWHERSSLDDPEDDY